MLVGTFLSPLHFPVDRRFKAPEEAPGCSLRTETTELHVVPCHSKVPEHQNLPPLPVATSTGMLVCTGGGQDTRVGHGDHFVCMQGRPSCAWCICLLQPGLRRPPRSSYSVPLSVQELCPAALGHRPPQHKLTSSDSATVAGLHQPAIMCMAIFC